MNARTDVAHFTLDGRPLCGCRWPANHDRMRAAGDPPCEDAQPWQLLRAAKLAEQFPNRIALIFTACPGVKS